MDSITALMFAYQALGRLDEAQETQQLLREYVASLDDPLLWALVGSSEARLALMQGQPEPAVRWLESSASPGDEAMLWWLDVPSVAVCRALITAGPPARLDEAQERLRALTEVAEVRRSRFVLQFTQGRRGDERGQDRYFNFVRQAFAACCRRCLDCGLNLLLGSEINRFQRQE